MPAICRFSAPVAASILGASVAVPEPMTVGAVDKVQAHVDATQAGQTRALVINSNVYFKDQAHRSCFASSPIMGRTPRPV